MRKWVKLIFCVLVLFGVLLIYTKFYYPPLPVTSVSKSELINKVNKSNGNIVKIGEENGFQWYISEMNQGRAYENLKELMADKGWFFKEQFDNSRFVFQNEQGEITVVSRIWNKKYVISNFPKEI